MELEQRVIDLHDIARDIEQTIGSGKLSSDVRDCADRLHNFLKPQSVEIKDNK
jgi:hypothetical protein